MRNTTRTTLLASVLVLSGAFSAPADEIKFGGNNYTNIRIVGMRDGQLYFEGPVGERSVALDAIESIKLDKYPEITRADTALGSKDYAGAAKTLAPLADRVEDEWLKVLVLAKLTFAHDRAGQFDQAVRRYAQLLKLDNGPIAQAARPRNVPKEAAARKKLVTALEADHKNTADPVVREFLGSVLAQLKGDPDAPMPETTAPSLPGPALIGGEREAARDVVGEAIAAGKLDDAMKLIEAQFKSKSADVSRLFYQQGQVLAAQGKDMDAALSFMRVVIHFPRSVSAIPARLEAGKLLVKMNRPNTARELWNEARGLTSDSDKETLAEIDALLASLPASE